MKEKFFKFLKDHRAYDAWNLYSCEGVDWPTLNGEWRDFAK